MPFCAQCGAQVDGKFCQSCGAVNPAFDGSGPSGPSAGAGGLSDNVAGALCYVLGFITGLLFLLISPYNRNPQIRFHAFQAIFFNIGLILLTYAVSSLGFLISAPVLLLSVLIRLGGLGVWIYLIVRAYQNRPLVLPIVGPLAQDQARSR